MTILRDKAAIEALLMEGGGPAFPGTTGLPDGGTVSAKGMSLRQWYAGQALMGFLARRETIGNFDDAGRVAEACCRFADDLLKELAK